MLNEDYYNQLLDKFSISNENDKITRLTSAMILQKNVTENSCFYENKNIGFSFPKGYDITKIVNFRIHLIQQLVILAVENFVNNLDDIEKGKYHEELIFNDEHNLAKTLREFCGEKIFKYREINSLEVTGHSVIKGLLDYYIYFIFHQDKKYRKRATQLISESIIKVACEECGITEDYSIDKLTDYYKLRVIIDFISGMTDQYALNHYQKISGQKII